MNNIILTDWDEVYDSSLDFLLNYESIHKTENISKKVDQGYQPDTKIKLLNEDNPIEKINIGDILSTGGIVYGIVELNNNNLGNKTIYNLLVSNGKFEIGPVLHFDYNYNIDTILELNKNII